MPRTSDQILTVAQMRAAEEALIAAGASVDELMQRAGRGAAEWVWRMAAGRPVTVLCGPGNNGGDGYVIAEAIRVRGGAAVVIASEAPRTAAARNSRALYRGEIVPAARGEVLVDCLYGSGLTRPLGARDAALLTGLAQSHHQRIAVDLPSGVDSDTGASLNPGLPAYDLTLALGTWKFAHFLMPAAAATRVHKVVEIGLEGTEGAARAIERPELRPPAANAHKYTRGLLAVVAGAMPGAAILAATAAQRSGAGYVKVLGAGASAADLVNDVRPINEALGDRRIAALLCGPGLGRDRAARERLTAVLGFAKPAVLDADALMLLTADNLSGRSAALIVTPHDGELRALEGTFGLAGEGSKPARARALAQAAKMVVVAKGPDTVVAAPDGRIACARPASSWLSTAGTGDILAGSIASRLATGVEPFAAACEGVWLHGEAARRCGAAFTASELAGAIGDAYAAAL